MKECNQTLGDLGEFRVINEVILPALRTVGPDKALGDDCAFLDRRLFGDRDLVVTTDVGPKPLSWILGPEDYWSWGWYSVVVNLSDIASAGAKSLAFCCSIDAPADMKVEDLRLFFSGVSDACAAYDTINAGGNVRTAGRFACHGMAIGSVVPGFRIGRSGCKPGDITVAIGSCGEYIAAYLRAKNRSPGAKIDPEDYSILTRPVPRLREMAILAEKGLICAATDNSDGVLGSLWNIAERSNCGFELTLEDLNIPDGVRMAADDSGYDALNLFLCWGDWQIISCVPDAKFESFKQIAADEGIKFTVLGTAIEGPPALVAIEKGQSWKLPVLRNENFSPLSFNASVEAHVKYMLTTPLRRFAAA